MSIWRQVDDFPIYAVNEYGTVKHIRRDTPVKARLNKEGFLMVSLTRGKEQLTRSVAGLVANAFLPDPENAAQNSIIHLNGDREDCRAMNLMWRPRWFAQRYHDMFDDSPMRVQVYIPALDKRFASLREFCTTYGLIERQAYLAMINDEKCYPGGWIVERL